MLSCKLDNTAKLIARPIREIGYNTVTAIEMNSRSDQVKEHVPDYLQAAFDILMEELAQSAIKLNEVAPPDMEKSPETPEIPEELEGKIDIKTLKSHRKVNSRLDKHGRGMYKTLGFKKSMNPNSPEEDAAELLLNRCFKNGTKFLNIPGPQQWLATHKRFSDLKEDEIEAIRILGLENEVRMFVVLNDYYGKLLKITETNLDAPGKLDLAEQQKEAIKKFRELTTKLVAFANLAWPGSTKIDEDRRMLLLEPYINQLLRYSQKHSAKIKQAIKKRKEQEDNNSAPKN